MRQVTETRTIYKFSELPTEEAKQRAKEWYAEGAGYDWAGEAMDSIKALAAHFGGEVTDYSVDWFGNSYSHMRFDMPELSKKEIAEKLRTLGSYNKLTGRGHGDCVLTGYCADENAIDGFRLAYRGGERDIDKLMEAAFDQWLKDAQADCADFYSDKQFSEHCDANEYEFNEDGSRA